jgi:hypothetical protein
LPSNDVVGKLLVCAAGLVAEHLAGYSTHGGSACEQDTSYDLAQAWRIMGGDTELWRRALDHANEICRRHWPFVEQLAQEIYECGELEGRRVDGMWRLYLYQNPDLVTRETELRFSKPVASVARQPTIRAPQPGDTREVRAGGRKVGTTTLRADGRWAAYDLNGELVGVFDNSADASRAIPNSGHISTSKRGYGFTDLDGNRLDYAPGARHRRIAV